MFLTTSNLRPRVQGVPTTAFSDTDLTEAVSEAEDAAAAFLHLPSDSTLGYQEYVEYHAWKGGFTFYPYRAPLRRVTDITIVSEIDPDGSQHGYRLSPIEDLYDPETGSLTSEEITLFLQQIPFFSFIEPKLRLSYSAGYDDGTVQADGLSLPAPSRLTSALRIIVADILREWLVDMNLSGMTKVYSLQNTGVGITFQRNLPQRGGPSVSIPQRAVDLLDDFAQQQRVYIGA